MELVLLLVFIGLDSMFFYIFFEAVLIPMYIYILRLVSRSVVIYTLYQCFYLYY